MCISIAVPSTLYRGPMATNVRLCGGSIPPTPQTLKFNSMSKDKQFTPVIPKAVAMSIFREGVAYGVSKACDELDNTDDIEISDRECMGNFEVEFQQWVDLSAHIDLDWLRSEVGVNDEADVIEALKNLCADNKFECRIHGVDGQEKKKNN